MNINYADNGSDQLLSLSRQRSLTSAARGSVSHSLSRSLLRARVLFRRRPSLLALVIATGTVLTGITVAGSVVAHHVEARAAVQPLAPPPPPPPPAPAAQPVTHRILSSLHTNPLRGLASWYGDVWNGRKTASGETFDDEKLTAAHKTLPLGTIVRVTNLASHRTVIVKINDRGTLRPNRVIDLSSAAARELGMVEQGLANVKLEILGKA